MVLTGLKEVDTIYIDSKKFIPLDDVIYEVATSAPVSLHVTYGVREAG